MRMIITKTLVYALLVSLAFGQGFAQIPEKQNKLKFIFAGEIPPEARPVRGSGISKIQIINQSKDYVGLGFINSDGNLLTGYTDGKKGQTGSFIGPGSRTHKDWPYIVANGACFILYTLNGKILGYGTASETGEYEIVVR